MHSGASGGVDGSGGKSWSWHTVIGLANTEKEGYLGMLGFPIKFGVNSWVNLGALLSGK